MLNTIVFPSTSSNIELMLEAFFCVQPNEHVKAWKWDLYERGISVDRYGRLCSSRTGEVVA